MPNQFFDAIQTNYWWAGPGIIFVAIWSLYWKGKALWKAAHRNEVPWFIALLILNTAGIVEILYIYVFSKDKTSTPTSSK